jgi:hypothetical protein
MIATNPVIPFEVLLEKMKPNFKFFARQMKLKFDNFDDTIQDLTAIAFDIYRSLVRRGKEIFYSTIANFAIKRYKSGRRFAGSSTTDVLSDETRILGRCEICSLSPMYSNEGELPFLLDWKSNAADIVQFKMDFNETWYRQQPSVDRSIIRDLMMGETTGDIARKHHLTPSAVSHKKRQYAASWKAFNDPPEKTAA